MADTAPRRVCDDDDGHNKGGQPDLSSPEEWKRDIEVGWAAISTTGGQVWGAAHRLVDFLEATQHHFQLHRPGICILELGAGTGWLGMTLARNLPYAGRVWMTEQKGGGAMEWLSENLERNRERVRHRRGADAVRAVEDDWAEYDSSLREEKLPEALDHHWHLVIGSDLVYNDVGSRMLPTVLRAHAERGSTVLYCHTKHRLETVDLDFFARLEAVGLCWQELLEPEADDPPDSPPPLTDLFPEMRTAVLRIGLQEQQNTSAHL